MTQQKKRVSLHQILAHYEKMIKYVSSSSHQFLNQIEHEYLKRYNSNYAKGALLETTLRIVIQTIINDMGIPWLVEEHDVRAKDADIIIIHHGTKNVIAKFECTNFAPSSVYYQSRSENTLKNLVDVEVKGIITSFESNIQHREREDLAFIPMCYLGFQLLTKDLVKEHDDPAVYKLDSPETRIEIYELLKEFFFNIELFPVID